MSASSTVILLLIVWIALNWLSFQWQATSPQDNILKFRVSRVVLNVLLGGTFGMHLIDAYVVEVPRVFDSPEAELKETLPKRSNDKEGGTESPSLSNPVDSVDQAKTEHQKALTNFEKTLETEG